MLPCLLPLQLIICGHERVISVRKVGQLTGELVLPFVPMEEVVPEAVDHYENGRYAVGWVVILSTKHSANEWRVVIAP